MDQENEHMLKKAINEMPIHVAPVRVWPGIQSEIIPEQNRIELEKAVKNYKRQVASPVLWEELVSRMSDHTAGEKDVNRSGVRKISFSKAGYWLAGIAASVLIGVCIYLFVNTAQQEHGAPGNLADATPALPPGNAEEEALKFIDRFCSGENTICSSGEFLELKAELDESAEALEEISRQLSVFQNDPGLLNAKSKIEKYRAEILREITLMI